MFQSARVKLTIWYLAIIMTVSVSFSIFIYKIISVEFERRIGAIESRLELKKYGFPPPPRENVLYFIEDINESRKRVLIILFNTNIYILIFSFAAGYFLAGKTLNPIEEALNDQKRFVADASHELKTPITSLMTSIEVGLRDKKINLKEAKSILRDSLIDINNLKRLVESLLTLAKNSDRKKTFKKPVNLRGTVDGVLSKYSNLAKARNLKVIKSVADAELLMEADDLDRLIGVLVDNAIKYSKPKGIVSIKTEKFAQNLRIVVEDNGLGIAKENLPKIFERFYRADSSRSKTKVSGFGLGLSIAKRIVGNYGGQIKAESTLGKGSKFIVILPLS